MLHGRQARLKLLPWTALPRYDQDMTVSISLVNRRWRSADNWRQGCSSVLMRGSHSRLTTRLFAQDDVELGVRRTSSSRRRTSVNWSRGQFGRGGLAHIAVHVHPRAGKSPQFRDIADRGCHRVNLTWPSNSQLHRLDFRHEPRRVEREERGHNLEHGVAEAADVQDVAAFRGLCGIRMLQSLRREPDRTRPYLAAFGFSIGARITCRKSITARPGLLRGFTVSV